MEEINMERKEIEQHQQESWYKRTTYIFGRTVPVFLVGILLVGLVSAVGTMGYYLTTIKQQINIQEPFTINYWVDGGWNGNIPNDRAEHTMAPISLAPGQSDKLNMRVSNVGGPLELVLEVDDTGNGSQIVYSLDCASVTGGVSSFDWKQEGNTFLIKVPSGTSPIVFALVRTATPVAYNVDMTLNLDREGIHSDSFYVNHASC
jgi:hypothetical protein